MLIKEEVERNSIFEIDNIILSRLPYKILNILDKHFGVKVSEIPMLLPDDIPLCEAVRYYDVEVKLFNMKDIFLEAIIGMAPYLDKYDNDIICLDNYLKLKVKELFGYSEVERVRCVDDIANLYKIYPIKTLAYITYCCFKEDDQIKLRNKANQIYDFRKSNTYDIYL